MVDVLLGSTVTSLLFTVGKFLIASIWERRLSPQRMAPRLL